MSEGQSMHCGSLRTLTGPTLTSRRMKGDEGAALTTTDQHISPYCDTSVLGLVSGLPPARPPAAAHARQADAWLLVRLTTCVQPRAFHSTIANPRGMKRRHFDVCQRTLLQCFGGKNAHHYKPQLTIYSWTGARQRGGGAGRA